MNEADPAPQHGGLPLFFAFQDGQFANDCDRCDARCCLDVSGVALLPDQLGAAGNEIFEPLVSDVRGGLLRFDTGLGGCPALSASGRCRIHAERGRRHQPPLCALFPFDRLVRTPDFCAVVPQFTSCPSLVLDPPRGVVVRRNSDIADDLSHYFGDSLEPFKLISVPACHGVSLESEQRLLEIVNTQRGKATLGAALSEASGRPESELRVRAAEALELLGLDVVPESPADVELLLPMIPALRTDFYHLELPDIDVALLLGWRFVVAAAAPGVALGMRRMASLIKQANEYVGLAVRAQRPVRLEGPLRRQRGGIPQVALEVALVLRHAQRNPGQSTLSELLSRHVRAKGVCRSLVIRELSRAGLEFE